MGVEKYIDLVTSQHKVQPNFIEWLSAPLNIMQDGIDNSNDIVNAFDIDTSIGVQLDVLGDIVGCSRQVDFQPTDGSSPVLDDYNYRMILKAKIAKNQWDGTTPDIYDIWNDIFPNYNLFIADNQDMTMTAKVIGITSILQQNLVQNGYVVPKPSGVNVNYQFADISNSNVYIGIVVHEGSFETVRQT